MVLETKHRHLLNMNGLELDDIGFVFSMTRERVRQILEGAIGDADKQRKEGSKTRKIAGKMLDPKFGDFKTVRDKMNFMRGLRNSLRELHGSQDDNGKPLKQYL
jgi:hypothetical protein